MSYTFLPPRTSFFPSGPPYLAGLGDWSSDNAAYQAYLADLDKWNKEKAAYDYATVRWAEVTSAMDKDYARALSFYAYNKSQYDQRYAAYLKSLDTYNTQYAGIKRSNTEQSIARTKGYGITLPQGYFDAGACITQAQQTAYARGCQTVKGLGRLGLGSSDSDCAMSKLPICAYPPKPTFTLKAPVPPPPLVYPAKPTLRAPPTLVANPGSPPVTTTTPTTPGGGRIYTQLPKQIPNTTSAPDPGPGPDLVPEEPKQAGMLMNGLILVAVLGGGYLVYRTLKKPKAQAA